MATHRGCLQSRLLSCPNCRYICRQEKLIRSFLSGGKRKEKQALSLWSWCGGTPTGRMNTPWPVELLGIQICRRQITLRALVVWKLQHRITISSTARGRRTMGQTLLFHLSLFPRKPLDVISAFWKIAATILLYRVAKMHKNLVRPPTEETYSAFLA